MEYAKLVEALRSTVSSTERSSAESYLSDVQKIVGFSPNLLKIVVSQDLESSIRQAAVIYLKNMITAYWDEKPAEQTHGSSVGLVFTIHEQDRHIIREHIMEAIAATPEVLRVQLSVCIQTILKHDFPGRWPNVVDKIVEYLNFVDGAYWLGALSVLYQLVKNYEFKKPAEQVPLTAVMKRLLPLVFERMAHLTEIESQESAFLQKLILKIFYSLNQFSLNFELMTKEDFSKWMELVRKVLDKPVPAETLAIDEEDRPQLIWWKCKKWAVSILSRIFERYGSPGQVSAEYNQFAQFYLHNFVGVSTESMLRILNQHRNHEYVAPRVLHQALFYIQCGISHAFSWKFIKPHILEIIQSVIFPLMSYSPKDEQLWTDDPEEFIRAKYDVFDELLNPANAAVSLLKASMKRRDLLTKVAPFIVGILNDPNPDPSKLDGALHMVGVLEENLSKKKSYKDELENLLVTHVFPRFSDPNKFLRARACWCISMFSELTFSNEANLLHATEQLVNRLLTDPELPVKVEAAIAIQTFLDNQPKVEKILQNYVRPVVTEILKLISDTKNDDLATVLTKFVTTYLNEVKLFAVEVAQSLTEIFVGILQSDEDSEERSIVAIGVLGVLSTLLDVLSDHDEILQQVEPVVLNVVQQIVNSSEMDFYEEALNLAYSLTCVQISDSLWKLYPLLYEMFKKDGYEYFTDLMPILHNYVTIDPETFLAVPERLAMLFEICKHMLTTDAEEDAECHAAKMIEVVVLQYRGRIDSYIRPFTELILNRLTLEVKTSELRTMCLQVLIACLMYKPSTMIEILQVLQPPDSNESLIDHFVKQWIFDTDCFLGLHDRKMCLFGLCTLMALPERLPVLQEVASQIIPSCLLLFDGLQRAYESKAQRENKDDSDSGEDVSDEEASGDDLQSDEDEIDAATQGYLERLTKSEQDSGNDDEYSDSSLIAETDLESYETALDKENCDIDEYIMFKETLLNLQQHEPQWYLMLMSNLNESQHTAMQNVFKLADLRKAAAESRKINQRGGYQFDTKQVPVSFDFGGQAF